ncbi:hypothetical protein PF010_g17573 [Phytophthora fragariae]|uniref:Uncharacterized protein n=1 Tax=Phytophthora fragariae TaxID=53985 RepID=A0A6G0KMQ7_9STRA|nr:hypothetical protein PF010_g17573 [Phytophthora fragariae]
MAELRAETAEGAEPTTEGPTGPRGDAMKGADMKIETAHLRERLRPRVGGDTTAVDARQETNTAIYLLKGLGLKMHCRHDALDGAHTNARCLSYILVRSRA